MNKTLKELLNKRKKVNKSLTKVNEAIRLIHRATKVPCSKCGKKTSFANMEIYRILWREIIAEHQYVCEECGYVNRLLNGITADGWRRYYLDALETNYIFSGCKIITDVFHGENEPAKKHKFVNNFFVEKLIEEEKEFEDA